ncbi:hypothetical protein P3X46_025515 [Hevea brasiliensis]|uniref:TF-B3 domain-containing protein n=2 Tax=Hevea brasiliensis TaxID=3981 RepID=A0ABQ9L9D1_HEVBR|nr:hypothetical protein P3X46_025515 [Hevea brasiliensis]
MDSMGSLFLKFILENTVKDGKLMIPRKFARQYANSLSNPVTLKLPSGAAWQVELLKNERDIWFDKGWKEFAQHYSLDLGDTVVFKYEKDSHFHVFICDQNGIEIEYPSELNVEEDEDEDEDKDIIELVCEKSVSKKAKLYIFRDGSELANNLITENPSFHFVVKSYHLEKGNVYVPNSFMKELMEITETESILLQVADKVKVWPVNVRFYPLKRMGCLTSGFVAFARENSLQAEDVCVFQLIKNNILNVSIFKNAS